MPELKHGFGAAKMNKDLDERIVPNGEYRDALNIEISTSEGSDVGTMQTLLGNRDIKDINSVIAPSLFSTQAKCVGSVADEKNNHIYYFVADPANHADYIMMYNSNTGDLIPVVVDKYQVEQEIVDTTISTPNSDPKTSFLIGKTGASLVNADNVRPGMVIQTNDFTNGNNNPISINFDEYYTVIRMKSIGGAQWEVFLDLIAPHYDVNTYGNTASNLYNLGISSSPINASGGRSIVKFRAERVLNFCVHGTGANLGTHYFPPITGINFMDNMLFWTDGKSEPKRIIIDNFIGQDTVRGKSGTHPRGDLHSFFNTYHPNEVSANNPNGLIISDNGPSGNMRYDFRLKPDFLREEHITVVKKSPLSPPTLIMSNTSDGRFTFGNQPAQLLGETTDQAIFIDDEGNNLPVGSTVNITFNSAVDYLNGDLILLKRGTPFSPSEILDEELIVEIVDFNDTTYAAKVKIVWIQKDNVNDSTKITNNQGVEHFEMTSTSFHSILKQEKPLYEFKLPKFAFRYKYQDNQYSSYSPFSEVAFLPGLCTYIPKEGYNLGMVNTLRSIHITDFVPDGIPKDVVEIDILYKESNSTNVYKVKTIKYNDEEWLLEGSVVNAGIGGFAQYARNTGRVQITSEMVRSAVASNQLIRPWDNVPRTAKAQEIVGNRIVYANYLQNYNL